MLCLYTQAPVHYSAIDLTDLLTLRDELAN
jgi:hypothetical protein